MPTVGPPEGLVIAAAIRATLPTIAAVESVVAKLSTMGQPAALAADCD